VIENASGLGLLINGSTPKLGVVGLKVDKYVKCFRNGVADASSNCGIDVERSEKKGFFG
jgi:hypothetical protein